MVINWNKEAIQTNTKQQFIDSHQHYADVADLEKVWEDSQEPKKAEVEDPPAEQVKAKKAK